MYVPRDESDATGVLEAAFRASVACEPIDRKLRESVKAGRLVPRPDADAASLAREAGVISAEEYGQWQKKEALRKEVIKVDDFPADFGRAEALEKLERERAAAQRAAA